MIHLKIISANLPPNDKQHNSFIKIIPVYGNNKINPNAIYKTKIMKKTNNPEWNTEYYIPFYCFDSVFLEFWDKKLIGEKYIGKGQIFFTPDSFNQDGPQRIPIALSNSSSSFQAYFTYSISPIFSSLDNRPLKFESFSVYTFLTYDPPLKSSQNEEVYLYVQTVNENGTIYEKIFKDESKKRKMGPSGLTDVYNFISYFAYDNCFYYVKSINYTGKVTLNFANFPYLAQADDISQYFSFTSDISVQVCSQKDVNFSYSIFPYTFKISKDSFDVKNFHQFPNGINPQKVPLNPPLQFSKTNDNFLNSFNYFHSNPDGVALKTILDAGSKEICPPNLTFHYRYLIESQNRYNLKSAFKFHCIEGAPSKIDVCFSHDINSKFTYFVYKAEKGGKNLDKFGVGPESAIDKKTNEIGLGVKDRATFSVSLDLIEKSAKYVAFVATSKEANVLNGASCRVVDEVSKKELMVLDTTNSSGKKSVLAAMLVRNEEEEEDWEFWSCMQFFTGDEEDSVYEFMNTFLTDGVNEIFQ